ncbi:MAG TPA: hypothetical protein VF146_13450, partial [Bryobacteraceae bacterium]
ALYRVPRRWPSRARVVTTAQIDRAQAPRSVIDRERLQAYQAAVEQGPDSQAVLSRKSSEALRIRATFEPGQSLLVQESYDRAWHAWSRGRMLPVREDAMGFMLVDTPPGVQDVSLVFVTPFENQIGRVLTIFSVVLCILLFVFEYRARLARSAALRLTS